MLIAKDRFSSVVGSPFDEFFNGGILKADRSHTHRIPVGRMTRMHYVRQEDLPFVGSSHEFVGAEQGDAGVSVFLFHGKPGSGPGPHRHPYDEIQFIAKAVVCG